MKWLNSTHSAAEGASLPYVAVQCTKDQPLIVFIFYCVEFDPINNAGCNDISNVLINISVAAKIASKTSLMYLMYEV